MRFRLKNFGIFREADLILPGNQACCVKLGGTTKELSEVLDLTGMTKEGVLPRPAMITVVTGYGGFALMALWE